MKNSIVNNSPNFKEFIDDLSVLNIHPLSNETFSPKKELHKYGLLYTRSNDRYWLLPISSCREARSGLEMFRPLSFKGRLARMGVEAAINYGYHGLWTDCFIYLSNLPQLDVKFSLPVSSCAYFTGTAGPHRKTTIQLMSEDGSILGFIKLTRKKLIADFILAEGEMLDVINSLKLKSAKIPSKLACWSNKDGSASIATDSSKSNVKINSTVIRNEHLSFLLELYTRTKNDKHIKNFFKINTFIESTARELKDNKWHFRLMRGSNILKKYSDIIELCLNHGDFTPWNSFLGNEGLYVFDWEYSQHSYPAGYDLVRFILCMPNRRSDSELNNYIISNLAEIYFDNNIMLSTLHYYVILITHSSFYLHREWLWCGKIWKESNRYADLIDSCAEKIE